MPRSHFCCCVLCAAIGLVLAFLLLFGAPQTAQAQAPKGPVSFINDVAPILKESCFGCHGTKNPKGRFNMTTFDSFHKGGTKETPFVAGKPEDSLIIDALKATDKTRMPPKEAGATLPKEKIAILEQWIKEGAKLDANINAKADLQKELRARWSPPTPKAAYPYPVQITSVAFTPDNLKLVVSGHHELTVWDIASGKLEKRIYTRTRRAMAMLFLPDGKLAVAGGRPNEEGDVRIYDINGGTPKTENGVAILDGVNDKGVMLKQLLEADDEVTCLALSADGKKLASGGCDRIVNIWDISGGYANAKLEQSIENHADWVYGVAFSPDGKLIFTCSRDKTAKVWDLAAKELVVTFPDHQAGLNGVAVKSDGKMGISVGEDNQLREWNVFGEQAGKQVKGLGNHAKAILKLAAHPTKPVLVTAGADGVVKVWNSDTGAALKTLTGHTDWVYAVAISPDANLVASGTYNGEVKVWKIADGSVVKSFIGSPGAPPEKPVENPKPPK
jgi:WD40 repeat protein